MVRATVQESSLPPGQYDGDFVRVDEGEHPEYGPNWRWVWQITSQGAYRGKEISRTTKPTPTNQNSCGYFCEVFSGKSIRSLVGSEIDPAVWYGTPCHLVVKETQSGSTRVENFVVATTPAPAPLTRNQAAVELQAPPTQAPAAAATADDDIPF